MRITKIDLQIEDLMWFGVDNQNHIFECTTAGVGNVPEFVCRSKEKCEQVEKYFLDEAEEITEFILHTEYENNQLFEDCLLLARKGIFCYDVSTADPQQYKKISSPVQPLKFDDLPENIKKIMIDNKVDINAKTEPIIRVGHAY